MTLRPSRVNYGRISIDEGLEQDTLSAGDRALTKVICETLLIADDVDDHTTVDEQSWGDEMLGSLLFSAYLGSCAASEKRARPFVCERKISGNNYKMNLIAGLFITGPINGCAD
jgi:hypothetical protein